MEEVILVDISNKKVVAKKYYYSSHGKEVTKKYRSSLRFKQLRKNSSLLRNYGITLKQYELMLIKQDNECAICSNTMSGYRNCHVDHDHKHNIVRGLLCMKCNSLLGYAKDNPMILRYAINYLAKFESQCLTRVKYE
jgi:hypothetical protein